MDRDTYRVMARASDRRVLVGTASLARDRLSLLIKFLSLYVSGHDRRLRDREEERREPQSLLVVSAAWTSATSFCWRAL
jgi:hypothetical protein